MLNSKSIHLGDLLVKAVENDSERYDHEDISGSLLYVAGYFGLGENLEDEDDDDDFGLEAACSEQVAKSIQDHIERNYTAIREKDTESLHKNSHDLHELHVALNENIELRRIIKQLEKYRDN